MSLPINGSSERLQPNWFLTHKPAPGSDVPYVPKAVDFAPERSGDFGAYQVSGDAGLRSIERETVREDVRTERAAR